MVSKPNKAYVNWPKVKIEVTKAARKNFGKKNFVYAKRVAEYIKDNPEKHPHFRGITFPAIQLRTTKAMQLMNWPQRGLGSKRGSIFIAPWGDLRCSKEMSEQS